MEDKENGNFGIEEAEREEMKANGDDDDDEDGEGIDENIDGNRISNKKNDAPPHHLFLIAPIIVACLAISCGCGIQLNYSILNNQPSQFYPPFLLMWFNNNFLIFCFPLFLLYAKMFGEKSSSAKEICQKSAMLFSKAKFQFGKFLWMELLFLALFNINVYTNSLSLGRISTSAAMCIHSLEVSIVYILGRLFLHEQFLLLKTVGVFLAMTGVVFIALDNEFAANSVGVLLKLGGCFASSIYKVAFKRAVGNGSSTGQRMFFLSGMGLANLLINFPMALLLLHFGMERFNFDYIPWLELVGFISFTFVFNFSTIFGIALLSPMVISIGAFCGIPISIGIDIFLRNHGASWKFLLGTKLLLISLILVTFHEQIRNGWTKWQKTNHRKGKGEGSEAQMEEEEKEEEEALTKQRNNDNK